MASPLDPSTATAATSRDSDLDDADSIISELGSSSEDQGQDDGDDDHGGVDEAGPRGAPPTPGPSEQQQATSASLLTCLRDEVPARLGSRLLWVTVVLTTALFLGASQTQDECSGPLVSTVQGQVCGRVATATAGFPYHSFQGIPYAKPPVGELRFKDPQPAAPWTGVRRAVRPGPPCLQSGQGSFVETLSPTLRQAVLLLRALPGFLSVFASGRQQSEDCLFLNVYTRQVTPPTPLPVMVWIHGGGFHMGSGSTDVYGPDYLLDSEQPVLLVTFNYRLGPLGFLNVPGSGADGNVGLKDQAAVLRWVRDNIAAFGGDPDRVTIFGESAGGTSVQMHMLSPISRGLFHYAISQSGSALNPRSSLSISEARDRAYRLGRLVGVDAASDEDLVNRLRQLPATVINSRAESVLSAAERSRGLAVHPFVPAEEPAAPGAFLPGSPNDLMVRGGALDVPYITGINDLEAGFFLNRPVDYSALDLNREVENLMPVDLGLEPGSAEHADVARRMKRSYFGDASAPTEMELAKFYSDLFVSWVVHRTVNILSPRASAPLYVYVFTHDGGRALSQRLLDKKLPGVCHTDELGYLFTQSVVPRSRETDLDDLVTKRMVTLWTNFARNGNPNSPSPLLTTEWLPANNQSQLYLEIGRDLALRKGSLSPHMDFWDSVYTVDQGGRRR